MSNLLKEKDEIVDYDKKSKTLIENGWVTWYNLDNWIKKEWIEQGKSYDYMGHSTEEALVEVFKEKGIIFND